MTALNPVIQALWMYPWLARFGPWKRYMRNVEETDAVLYAEIAARRQDPSGDDILSLLVANTDLSDAQLRDEVMTLLIAGHETTATALSWAFERLTRHPDAMARAITGDDDYLDAVVKETLRVRPVVVDVVRSLDARDRGGRLHAAGRDDRAARGRARAARAGALRRRRSLLPTRSASSTGRPPRTRGFRSEAACGAASAPRSRRSR